MSVVNIGGSEFLIDNYGVGVHLGTTDEESRSKQEVHITVKINFKQGLAAENTDQLSDTIDYVEVIRIIDQACALKTYKLIESLAYTVAQSILSSLTDNLKALINALEVSVYKSKVPVNNLRGVKWTYRKTL